MKVYITRDGHLYWGNAEIDVVDSMRKSEFVMVPHGTNLKYMKSVAKRIRELDPSDQNRHSLTAAATAGESEFLAKLVELGFMVSVDSEYDCPIAHTFCMEKRQECGTPNAGCWLKKQEEG